ncbi:MAG: hypothetical protein KGM87_14970, partial [Betaproteobacteria bacterium]|nr:hypothetical protein [Betaproteobacteria bacterium]
MSSSSAASAFSAPSNASPRLSALRTACLAAAMTATMAAAHPALAQGAAPSPAGRLEPADGAQGVQRLVQPRLRLA